MKKLKVTELSMSEDGYLPLHEQNTTEALYVVPKDVCTRCGACDPICPVDCISFDDRQYPVIDTSACVDCGLCVKVCPGIEFDYKAEYQKMFGVEQPPEGIGGIYESAFLAFANDSQIHKAGSGGGVVTQMLIGMVKEDIVDAAVTVGYEPDDPITPVPVICRTKEEILATAGSKYCVVPQAKVIRQLKDINGRFAFVGVGCQIEGLRNLERIYRPLKCREILTIGLTCHGTLEKEATTELLNHRKLPRDRIKRFFYRGGEFPGKFQIETLDGQRIDLHKFEYKDGAYNYLYYLYTPQRCLMCPDFSSEFADISVSDFWVRGEDGEYLHPQGTTLVMCRTKRGQEIFQQIRAKGYITAMPLGKREVDISVQRLYRDKRISPSVRIKWRESAELPAPQYHLQILPPTLSDCLRERLRQVKFVFAHSRWTRKLMIRLFFSPLGNLFTAVKMRYKTIKAARGVRKEAKQNNMQDAAVDTS